MPTLSDYQRVSQKKNDTLGPPYGSSNHQDKIGFGSVPHRNITFELQVSYMQCYYDYLRVFISILLIAPRLFQSIGDYTFF